MFRTENIVSQTTYACFPTALPASSVLPNRQNSPHATEQIAATALPMPAFLEVIPEDIFDTIACYLNPSSKLAWLSTCTTIRNRCASEMLKWTALEAMLELAKPAYDKDGTTALPPLSSHYRLILQHLLNPATPDANISYLARLAEQCHRCMESSKVFSILRKEIPRYADISQQWERLATHAPHLHLALTACYRRNDVKNNFLSSHFSMTSDQVKVFNAYNIRLYRLVCQCTLRWAVDSGLQNIIKEVLTFADTPDFCMIDALVLAAGKGNLENVKLLCHYVADINGQDHSGNTALMRASRTQNLAIVQFLLEQGADVNLQCKEGYTALMHARALPIATALIEQGANIDIEDNRGYGWTALTHAATTEDATPVVSLLLDKVDMNRRDKAGRTELIKLVKTFDNRGKDVIKRLLRRGIDIDAQDEKGKTALMHACEYGHHDDESENMQILEWLISQKMAIDIQDNEGKTLLMYACNLYFPPFHQDSVSSRVDDFIAQIMHDGADIDRQDNQGKTALMYACGSYRYVSNIVVEQMIFQGADIEMQDNKGKTALMYAASCGGPKAAEKLIVLVQSGADIDMQDKEGKTALMYALSAPRPDQTIIERLLDLGADMHKRDNADKTALMHASSYHWDEVATLLVEHDANSHVCG